MIEFVINTNIRSVIHTLRGAHEDCCGCIDIGYINDDDVVGEYCNECGLIINKLLPAQPSPPPRTSPTICQMHGCLTNTDGVSHSPECLAEYEVATLGGKAIWEFSAADPDKLVQERDVEWMGELAKIGVAALAHSVRGGSISVERDDKEEQTTLVEAAEESLKYTDCEGECISEACPHRKLRSALSAAGRS